MMIRPFVISISGVSGSGKTSVVEELYKRLPQSAAFYFDDYVFEKEPGDMKKWIENGRMPDAWDLSTMEQDIRTMKGPDILLLDYPFGKEAGYGIGELIDTAVFLDVPLDIALVRRTLRDCGDKSADEILQELAAYRAVRRYYPYDENKMDVFDHRLDGSKSVAMLADEIITNFLR